MRSWGRRIGAVCVACIAVAATGCPFEWGFTLIYDQGNYGEVSGQSVFGGADSAPGQMLANAFELSPESTTISRVRWWGNQASDVTEPNEFIIQFFEDKGPGSPKRRPSMQSPWERLPDATPA